MMHNILERVPERRWNSKAYRNCFKIFRLRGVRVLVERRQCPTVWHALAAKRAGDKRWRDILRAGQETKVPPPGFLLWHLSREDEDEKEATCFFAQCSEKDWASILHAATCGCDGCWGRMCREDCSI